jgi:hypothetical protein
MTPRRKHPVRLVFATVVLISLPSPSLANNPKTDLPAIEIPAFLSIEQSRRELARAVSAEATAWVLEAVIAGLVRKDCELEIDLVPSNKLRQFQLNLTLSPRRGAEKPLRAILDGALAGLNSLGFRDYSATQTIDGSKLTYSATLLKWPK